MYGGAGTQKVFGAPALLSDSQAPHDPNTISDQFNIRTRIGKARVPKRHPSPKPQTLKPAPA